MQSSLNSELNPFEQSFASKPASLNGGTPSSSTSNQNDLSNSNNNSSTSLNNNAGNDKTVPPAIQVAYNRLTPGGTRKLPLPHFSPGSQITPGMIGYFKSGFTPIESGLRHGLSPGSFISGISGFTPGGGGGLFTPGLSQLLGLNNPPTGTLPSINNNNSNNNNNNSNNSNNNNNNNNVIDNGEVVPVNNMNNALEKQIKNETTAKQIPNKKRKSVDISSSPESSPPRKKSNKNNKPTTPSFKSKSNVSKNNKISKPTESRSSQNNNSNGSKKSRKEMTEDEKRKSFLERNRLAASKCRQRKKQSIEKMKDDLQFYQGEFDKLNGGISELNENLLNIRTILTANKSRLTNSLGYDIFNQLISLSTSNVAPSIKPDSQNDNNEQMTDSNNNNINNPQLMISANNAVPTSNNQVPVLMAAPGQHNSTAAAVVAAMGGTTNIGRILPNGNSLTLTNDPSLSLDQNNGLIQPQGMITGMIPKWN